MSRPALIVAHPGHEMMVLGWVESARPRVSILTDGSGRTGTSRIASSEKVLRAANADAGSVFGVISDPRFYSAVLDGDVELFVDIAARLADDLEATRPPYVAGDAREGFNPTHDICRMIINAAVARANRGGAPIANYAFFLFAPHEKCPPERRETAMWQTLGEEQLERKLATARAYPELAAEAEAAFLGSSRRILAQHSELAAIVDRSLDGMNERALATECLIPVDPATEVNDERPFYEIYGEKLVAAGTYQRAIRYREHVLPIERALAEL
ncbi:MAG: hypothetical protein JO197_18715 [Acidobacteria bacterium]|nr:hypothetical protein [Acidobacteriota bacterium]MBV9477161.1 hypothetical protein [Acidobacteriota bacterium]